MALDQITKRISVLENRGYHVGQIARYSIAYKPYPFNIDQITKANSTGIFHVDSLDFDSEFGNLALADIYFKCLRFECRTSGGSNWFNFTTNVFPNLKPSTTVGNGIYFIFVCHLYNIQSGNYGSTSWGIVVQNGGKIFLRINLFFMAITGLGRYNYFLCGCKKL